MTGFRSCVVNRGFSVRQGAVIGVVLILAACGGGSSGGNGSNAPSSALAANATSNVSTGQAPLSVSFDASKSTDSQGNALTYVWTFGDGATATGVAVAHTYQDHGSYTATVA